MADEINPQEFKKDWEEFKKTNESLLKAKADGKSVVEHEEKLAKINERLDAAQVHFDRMARVETAMKRMGNFEVKGLDGQVLSQEQVEHKTNFLRWFRKGDASIEERLPELQTKALAVADDTSGGFMVHADLSGRIIKKIFETSPIRSYAAITTISTDALEGPIDGDQADAGWVSERGVRTQTRTPKIGMWRIPVHEIYAEPAATQKLLDDAAWDPEQWLAAKVADKFARVENAAFVNGTGVGQPKGFLQETTILEASNYDSYISDKKIGFVKTGAAADFPPVPAAGTDPAQADPLINLVFALKTQYRESAGTAFAMHRTTFGRVRRLRDNLGNYLWQPGLGGVPSTILGYPIAEFNDMPQIAAGTFPIAFANWQEAYQIVDRLGIRVLRDPYTAKPFVLFYTTKRVGGSTLNFEAIKLLKVSA